MGTKPTKHLLFWLPCSEQDHHIACFVWCTPSPSSAGTPLAPCWVPKISLHPWLSKVFGTPVAKLPESTVLIHSQSGGFCLVWLSTLPISRWVALSCRCVATSLAVQLSEANYTQAGHRADSQAQNWFRSQSPLWKHHVMCRINHATELRFSFV